MKRQTRSILNEIQAVDAARDRVHLIERRGDNVIAAAVNLLSSIKESYGSEAAEELEKRLINSIRTGDARKFARGCRRIISGNDE